jgi:hypothetical protein
MFHCVAHERVSDELHAVGTHLKIEQNNIIVLEAWHSHE